MDPGTLFRFGVGLVLIIVGAELLVRSASQLAAALGVTPLVIGLTVVAFGTGSPELAVALRAGFAGNADIAIGNVIGSNIFNVLFILGLSAAIVPLVVANQLVRLDVPIMIAASLLFLVMALDLRITTLEGAVLSAGIVAYTALLLRQSRREAGRRRRLEADSPHAPDRIAKAWVVPLLILGLGLGLLIVGSEWLVVGAQQIAAALGVSQLVIGLTVVAAGTSLPEVATSVVAGIRGQRDIAVGNVVGSNIYNLLMVVGVAALVSPSGLGVAPAALNFDIPVMVVVALACLPIFFIGNIIRRWEGVMFLAYWCAYTAYVILRAAEHDALPAFSRVMSLFVLPLTLVTVVLVALGGLRAERLRRRTERPGPPAGSA